MADMPKTRMPFCGRRRKSRPGRDIGRKEPVMFEILAENLKKLGYRVSCFATAAEAAACLDAQIDGQSVGFGGSVTLEQMGLYERLGRHNTVFWHQGVADKEQSRQLRMRAGQADIYLSSVNGLAETGEIVNIDGTCNRVASIFYGHRKVYLVVGKNKIAGDYEGALYRARNRAAPLNAKRLGAATPCAARADKCHDCKSPARICRGLSVLWEAPLTGEYEVILINEELGY